MRCILYLYLIGFLTIIDLKGTTAQQISQSTSYTEFLKGQWQVGLKGGFGGGILLSNRSIVQLQGGYHIIDHLSIGLSGSYVKEFNKDIHSDNLFSIGPFLRYQFNSGRFSPFTELSYQLGRQSTRSYTGMQQCILFTPGLSCRVVSGLRIDLNYGFQFIDISQNGHLIGQPQIGINFNFSNNKN